MGTDTGRWQRLEQLFHEGLAVQERERGAWLAVACGGDDALRAEVEAMLAAQREDRPLGLERWVNDEPLEHAEADGFPGRRLGPWQVRDLIGRGGMGRVYLAERADGQFEQRVALKVADAAALSRDGAAAFDAERRILARLSHPNVARLLDAGFTPEGTAYLVMEYVDGAPIVEYCDERRLTIDERLRLFRVVCNAVQHAHGSLVVHRDLKPSNIFVTRAGEVKLLDFGIAKLLEPDSPARELTAPGRRPLTPDYAAPEQVLGGTVTTATDVYGLGVVLYELIAGRRPFDGDVAPDPHALPAWVTTEPSAPSVVVAARGPRETPRERAADLAAQMRATTAAKLSRRLAGDVDRVVLKALQREPAARYASAGQLAEEVDRLLDGRPVIAQPDTVGYRARRFVSRHRLAVALGTAAFGVIVAFAVVASLQARALAIERDRVRLEAERAQRVVALVGDLFALAEPAPGQGETITAGELLDRGTERIDAGLADDPASQEALYGVVGRIYASLGLHARAGDVFDRVVDLQRRAGRGETGDAADAMHALAGQRLLQNEYAAAERWYREALALRDALGAPASERAATLEGLGRLLSVTGRHEAAIAPLREAVVLRREERTPPEGVMSALHELGLALHRTGAMAEADELFREAVEIGRTLPPDAPALVEASLHLARFVHHFGRDPAGAEPIYRETVASARRAYASDHQSLATALGEAARNLRDLGRVDEAEPLMREALGMLERLYGERHREVVIATQGLGSIVAARGDHEEAEGLYRRALVGAREVLGAAHPLTLGAQRALAAHLEHRGRFDEAGRLRQAELAAVLAAQGERDVYAAIALAGLGHHHLRAGRPDRAEEYFRRALAVREQVHPPDHWRVDEARAALGACLVRQRRFGEAESLLVQAYERLSASRGAAAAEAREALDGVVALYEAWGRPDTAATYRAR